MFLDEKLVHETIPAGSVHKIPLICKSFNKGITCDHSLVIKKVEGEILYSLNVVAEPG